MGEMRGTHSVLVKKPEERKPLGRPRHNGRIILKWNVRTSTCIKRK
jgi:hypothetical protein